MKQTGSEIGTAYKMCGAAHAENMYTSLFHDMLAAGTPGRHGRRIGH